MPADRFLALGMICRDNALAMSEPLPSSSMPAVPVQAIEYEAMNSQVASDVRQLRLLMIFHYIYGPVLMLFSCIFIFHIVLGVAMLKHPAFFFPTGGAPSSMPLAPPPPPFVAWMMIIMGSFAVLIGWTLGILTIFSGRAIANRKARTFSIVIAAINCLSVPIGTALGVFTMVVLLRDSVKTHYVSAS